MVSKLNYIQTDTALAEASGFANQILGSGKSVSSSYQAPIFHEHYHWGSGWNGGYYPAYCGPSRENPPTSEKKDYSWVAIPAALIAMGTMYFIGQNHAEWSQATDSMSKLRQKYVGVKAEISNAHPSLKSTVQEVFRKEMHILDRIRSNAATGLLLKGILFASVVASGVGGLASGGYLVATGLEALLGYGCASTLVTSCAMLYRAGFSSMDMAIQQEARELQIAVNQASGVLNEIAQS